MSRATEKNPKLFAEMQTPHESVDALNAAAQSFLDDVGEAREKYRMAEVLTVCRVRYLDSSGEDIEAMLTHYYGDGMHAEATAAYAYGRYVQARQETISDLLKGHVKERKTSK